MTVAPDTAPDLLASLKGLDLTSADGRAGIRTLLSEIERLSPGLILQQAAGIELQRVGIRVPTREASWRESCASPSA